MTRVQTRYGDIFAPEGGCADDYPNISMADQDRNQGPVKLQDPAMRSFHAAERRLYELLHPIKSRLPKYKHRVQTIHLTGSWRSCAYQTELWRSDPNRYADPATTLHPRGLAIDVSTGMRWQRLIHRVLFSHGWRQSRPDDEPWHYSYHFTA